MRQYAALLLLGYSLSSCALRGASPTQSSPLDEARGGVAQIRVIITFQRPTADSGSLSAAISDACQCKPVFFRVLGRDSLIYVIALPKGRHFAMFDRSIMRNAPQLGIVSVEQDSVDHSE